MKRNTSISIIFTFIFFGIAGSFMYPARPRQISSSQYNMNLHSTAKQSTMFIDPELDNSRIETDNNIHPARKCAVCIG
eukprot:8915751-Ditylum_brightwellii.AAC.1